LYVKNYITFYRRTNLILRKAIAIAKRGNTQKKIAHKTVDKKKSKTKKEKSKANKSVTNAIKRIKNLIKKSKINKIKKTLKKQTIFKKMRNLSRKKVLKVVKKYIRREIVNKMKKMIKKKTLKIRRKKKALSKTTKNLIKNLIAKAKISISKAFKNEKKPDKKQAARAPNKKVKPNKNTKILPLNKNKNKPTSLNVKLYIPTITYVQHLTPVQVYLKYIYYTQPLGYEIYYDTGMSSYQICEYIEGVANCERLVSLPTSFQVESHKIYYGINFDTCAAKN
jgi:hypothetical protein